MTTQSINITATCGAITAPTVVEYQTNGDTAVIHARGPWGVHPITASDIRAGLVQLCTDLAKLGWQLTLNEQPSVSTQFTPERTENTCDKRPSDNEITTIFSLSDDQKDSASNLVAEIPEITEEMRAVARAHPKSWLYAVDPEFNLKNTVPRWAIRGGYRIDEHCQFGPWVANPQYRPGPQALGFPAPTNQLERDLELFVSGYGSYEAALATLLDWELTTAAYPEHPGELFLAEQEDGSVVLDACTSPDRVPESWHYRQLSPGSAFLNLDPALLLRLNENVSKALTVTIPLRDLIAYARAKNSAV